MLVKKAFIVIVALVFLVMNSIHVTASNQILILVDGNPQLYQSDPVIVKGRILVPLRDSFEMLGATVDWDRKTDEIRIALPEGMIVLKVGHRLATMNDRQIFIDVAPKVINDRAYIPLRFVAEAMGLEVNWDSLRNTAEILTPSKIVLYNYTIAGLQIGDAASDVRLTLGNHKDRLQSQYQFDWFVYHQKYQDYVQIGMYDDEVVAFYTNSDQFFIDQISTNSTKEDVQKALGLPVSSIVRGSRSYQYHQRDEWDLYLLNDMYYTTFFYDLYNQNKVTAIHMVRKDYELALPGYYGTASESLRKAYERQLFHLVNATRVKHQIMPVFLNDSTSLIARAHSEDMAGNDYFDHYNLQGKSPFDRLKEGGQNYRYAGENLAVGQFSAIFAHEGLMNSNGHRRNILNGQFQQIGIGVAFQENRPYFTEKFITLQ